MSTDRREFLGAAVGAGLALGGRANRRSGGQSVAHSTARPSVRLSDWDVSWTSRVSGLHRAVFDSPEVSEGLGLLRTLVWIKDYGEVYGATPAEMSAVVVLRHNAIWMVMNDEFWAQYGIGAVTKINDPRTKLPIKRNPFLGRTPFADLPPQVADNVLTKVLSVATVLACNLAFQDVVEKVKGHAGGDEAKAHAMAMEHLVPGIILQPSGVFAVTRAQEAGCQYLLAS
jgi:hypothetical protein